MTDQADMEARAEVRLRLIQNGMAVAWATGNRDDAERTMAHYVFVYSQDGSVKVQERVGGRWKARDMPAIRALGEAKG